jgi:protocatechuate 3,4-dioxygenase beta subunit
LTNTEASPAQAGSSAVTDAGTGTGTEPTHPPYDSPGYRSTALRAPRRPPLVVADFARPDPHEAPAWAPVYGQRRVRAEEADLTRRHEGEPIGERVIVTGRVLGVDGRPVPGALLEIWQANACGRYAHQGDVHPAPLDPNFTGAGRCLADGGGAYRFVTIKPGAYPWGNHPNAWRPAHIHLSVFGVGLSSRLVTQMYFPGDPLFAHDPIFLSVPAPARERMVSAFDLASTVPDWALGYRFDIVLGAAAPAAAGD